MRPWSVRIGKNCVRGLEYGSRPPCIDIYIYLFLHLRKLLFQVSFNLFWPKQLKKFLLNSVNPDFLIKTSLMFDKIGFPVRGLNVLKITCFSSCSVERWSNLKYGNLTRKKTLLLCFFKRALFHNEETCGVQTLQIVRL